jgi:hypothetical protein
MVIEFKDGKKFNVDDMKNYILTESDFYFNYTIKHFPFKDKARLLKTIEDVFGEKGVLLIFINSYDFDNDSFDFDKWNKNMVKTTLNISKFKQMIWEINDVLRKIKWGIYDIYRFISYPIRELHHLKKYRCSMHTSYFFDSEILPMIYYNLEYYEKIIRKRYVIEGWLEKNLEDVQRIKKYCLACQEISGITMDIRALFNFLDYSDYVTFYTKNLILKSCDEIDKDLDEKLKEIMKVVMVSQI